jgi:hypothetical protein
VLDILVPEVVLQSACVVSVVGKLEAAGVVELDLMPFEAADEPHAVSG